MKRYVVKDRLSKKDKLLLDWFWEDVSNFIRTRRQFLIDQKILVVKEYEKNID